MATTDNAVIVGGGTVATRLHLPRVRAILGCTEVVIVESDPHRRQFLASSFRREPGISIAPSIPEGTTFSAAVIATPPRFHLEYFRLLKDRARDIIIEKPMVLNAIEAREIVEVARDVEARVYVALVRRTLEGFAIIQRVYRSQLFGRLMSVHVAEGNVFSWQPASTGSFSRDLNGGGVLMDTGPHTIDVLFQIFDSLQVEECWMDADVRSGRQAIEANCVLKMTADGKVPVTLNLTRNRNLSNTASFQFEGAVCTMSVRGSHIHVEMKGGVPLEYLPASGTTAPLSLPPMFDAYYERYVKGHDNTGVRPEDSEKIARVIDDAYAKAAPPREGF